MPVFLRDTTQSKDAAKFPWISRCDVKICYFSVSNYTEEQAQERFNTHTCPMRPTVRGFLVSQTILQEAWELLDKKMILVMGKPIPGFEVFPNLESTDITKLKSECRGMAEILALFMQPHMTTPDEIAREAMRRYKARQSGEPYETAGLGSRATEPPPGSPVRSAPSAPKHNLTSSDIEGIKNAAAMFSPDKLAEVYKVSVSVINSVLSGA